MFISTFFFRHLQQLFVSKKITFGCQFYSLKKSRIMQIEKNKQMFNKGILLSFLLLLSLSTLAQKAPNSDVKIKMDKLAEKIEAKVIAWRRDFHQNPELSNRETRTAKIIAEHLTSLGLEVRTGIAKTGVVGILKGGKTGPVVALRADIDALPVY